MKNRLFIFLIISALFNLLSRSDAAINAYVAQGSSGNIPIIFTPTNTITHVISVDPVIRQIAITPNQRFAYVTNSTPGSVIVIDLTTNTIISTITVGLGAQGVAITPNGNFAYVSSENTDTVSVINTSTNTVQAIISVANLPRGLAITLWGLLLYVSIEKRKGAKEPMIVVSNRMFPNALQVYRRRWEIETMFGCLKTRGFRMEDTHMTDPDKIERLLFVLAIAFAWAYRIGDIEEEKDPILMKSHGRKAKSSFRRGLDRIRRTLFRPDLIKEFRMLLRCFIFSKPRGYAA